MSSSDDHGPLPARGDLVLPSPAPKLTQEEKVRQAFTDGIISEEQCTQQLLVLRGVSDASAMQLQHATRLRALPDGTKQTVLCLKDSWQDVMGPFLTEKEAFAARNKVDHGGNKGLWAWNQVGCKKWMHCNYHVDCPVMLRSRSAGEGYFLQVSEGVCHALQVKEKERTNSALTRVQQEMLLTRVRVGASPRQMLEDDTMLALDAGKKKLESGGVEGVTAVTPMAHCTVCVRLFVLSCISSKWLCIRHVSVMYHAVE